MVAVLAAVVVVAILGGGGDGQPQPATTTTAAERTLTTQSLATTTSTPAPVVLGALLPEPTGTVLVAAGGRNVTVVDVDSGVVRTIRTDRSDDPYTGDIYGLAASGAGVLAVGPEGGFTVPLRAGDVPVTLPHAEVSAVLGSDRPGHFWLVIYNGNGTELREVGSNGEETGRIVDDLPPFAEPVVVADRGLVVPLLGSLTLYDPDDGTARALGHGSAIAAHGDVLARLACEALRCRLHLDDLAGGAGGVVADPPGATFQPYPFGAFSPDGRWLAVSVGETSALAGVGRLALVEVATRRVALADEAPLYGAPPSVAFSADSRWVFLVSGSGRLRAHRLETGEAVTIQGVDLSGTASLVAVAAP